MKKQGFNPFLPSWEYIPDGEPHLFDGRIYLYGSHDKFNGYVYCMNDYVCWSASEDDLTDWRYEGVIFKKTDDPLNTDGSMNLYAPDVTRGPDGRYYLYYVLDKADVVSVAVCSSPAGKYEFFGYVRYPDGTLYGRKEGDIQQFDPGVLTEGGKTYLYTGQCWPGDKTKKGSLAAVLDSDMITITQGPLFIIPGSCYSEGTGFEDHEFFEASSIRKFGDTYYFVYSSVTLNELCYATSKNPLKDFTYNGVIVSNTDMHLGKPMNHNGNNHGGIIEIKGKYYVFYHRHTNGRDFCRQACMEPLEISKDGKIKQAMMTSCGPNDGPLAGIGEYPACIACNFFSVADNGKQEWDLVPKGKWPRRDPRLPYVSQDGRDGDEEPGFVTNINDNYGIGFKFFNCKGIKSVKVKTRGYNRGLFEVKTSLDGKALGTIEITSSNIWKEFQADIAIPDGIQAIYFIYKGAGNATLGSFTLMP
jgi:arabinoxylan arabinofuranohydrolase